MTGNISTALSLLKLALGITHDKRDVYFTAMLNASAAELEGRGIPLNLNQTEDTMLLVDYAEFNYRSRDEEKVMPRNLDLRIRNRMAKGRAYDGT